MRVVKIIILILLYSATTYAQNDTINKIDHQHKRQGYWVITFKDSQKILEEGYYKDNERSGVWKQYLEDGTISSEITYFEDEPNGYAKIYHPNGVVAEEGIWKHDVWVGEYKAYHKNGHLIYKWNFNEQGLRTGLQEYYHDNGIIMISGNWEEGNESGVVTRYDEQGVLVLEQTYDNGIINPELTVEYKNETVKPENKASENKTVDKDNKTTDQQKGLEFFTDTGEQKLYDTKRRLTQEGYFENGKLVKGKRYYYNSDDEIVKIEIYNRGKLYKTEYPKEQK